MIEEIAELTNNQVEKGTHTMTIEEIAELTNNQIRAVACDYCPTTATDRYIALIEAGWELHEGQDICPVCATEAEEIY